MSTPRASDSFREAAVLPSKTAAPRRDGHEHEDRSPGGPEVGAATVPWQSVAALIIVGGLVVYLYYPVLTHLARQWWSDENYSHGFLIPFLSAYFVWDRRQRFRHFTDIGSSLGLGVLVAGLLLLLLGNVAAELFTMRASLLVVLAGLVLFLLGKQHLRLLAFPILYLIFMIPLPAILFNAIAFPLQLFAARTATASLQLIGIPVLREGNVITLANTALEVAEACSGLRSLVTLLALATTFAYLTQRGAWRFGILVASAVPIAIVANASRVAGTGILAHVYGPEVAQGFFHTFSGWFLFLVAAILLGLIGAILARLPFERRCADPLALLSDQDDQGQQHHSHQPLDRIRMRRVVIAVAVLAVSAASLPMLSHGESIPLRRSLDGFPAQIGSWRGLSDRLPPSILDVLGVSDYILRRYDFGGKPSIWLYVGYYETQRQGQTIHSPQQCLPGSGWNFLSHQRLSLDVPGRADAVTINNVLIGKGENRQVVLYWYQERGRVIASEYQAKLYMLTDAVTRNRTDGALVRLSTPVKGSEDEALQRAVEFTRLMFPTLEGFLPN